MLDKPGTLLKVRNQAPIPESFSLNPELPLAYSSKNDVALRYCSSFALPERHDENGVGPRTHAVDIGV